MTKANHKSNHIISFSPAEGWRVVHLDDDAPSGFWIEPMAGWLTVAETEICSRTYNPVENQPPLTERRRDVRPAVFADFMVDVSEEASFWKLLAPGQPDPTPEDVADKREELAVLARRRQHFTKAQ
ncbi:hypothetical protein [Glutamicibacter arilaitensis]|uniref:hypothetical protein n=1 Tax=Glutamicibacter arilaitensis TaxID=256701 RepID=UPI003F91F7BF